MMSLREYRSKSDRLADFLPWAALAAPGVVLNKDGSFQRTARFRGPDLDSATPAELVAVTARLNTALRRLGSGWAVFVEAQRNPAQAYPESAFPDPASALVDTERREQFREEGNHFESSYYLTLLWMPPPEEGARAESWLYEGKAATGVDPAEIVRCFVDRTDRLLHLVEGFMPETGWLDDAATLTYLHSTISTRRQRVGVPETLVYLDALLADEPLTGGLEPRLGPAHLRTLTVTGFPTVTFPGLLDELNAQAFAYRWSTRAIMLDKTDAAKLLTRIRRQWFAKRKSVAAILKEVMTNEQSVLVDSDASNKAADADMALQELGADHAGIAYVTATVTVWDRDPALASAKIRLVEKVIQSRDFTCTIEGMNAIEAWLGSSTLIVIDVTIAALFWAWGTDEDVLQRLVRKTLYIGVFAFIIGNFPSLAGILLESFAGLGLKASGSGMAMGDFMRPGRLGRYGPLDHRRHGERQRASAPCAYPDQADPGRYQHQSCHQHEQADLSSRAERNFLDLYGSRFLDLPTGRADRASGSADRGGAQGAGRFRNRPCHAQFRLCDIGRPPAMATDARLRRWEAGLCRVSPGHRHRRSASAVRSG